MLRHSTSLMVLSVFTACGGSDRHSEAPAAAHVSSGSPEVRVSSAAERDPSPSPPVPATVSSAPASKNPALRPSLRSPELAELRSNMMHTPPQSAGGTRGGRGPLPIAGALTTGGSVGKSFSDDF